MGYELINEDCIEHMAKMPPKSVDFSVFSPPFPALYAYTSESCDIGNSENFRGDAKLHLGFFYKQLARIIKPGRVVMVHVMQIPRLKRSGEVGLNDFRGLNIRIGERAGLIYEYDWSVRKNPQAQAIRTRSRELQFAGLESDRAKSRGTLADYLIKFRAPGENTVPICDKGSWSKDMWREWWIDVAESQWSDILETDTLNTGEAKAEDDTRHICPLQLEVYRRLIMLYTNPGELVFEPFAGIGSGGFVALGGLSPKTGNQIPDVRQYYGCEIKPEYFAKAHENIRRAILQNEQSAKQKELF
jgi:DNA modification methylase